MRESRSPPRGPTRTPRAHAAAAPWSTPRWRSLLGASDRALGALLADTALALRAQPQTLHRWAHLAGLPEGEVLASPFGARMIALGLEVGATTVHHERRPLLRWHKSLRARGAVTDPLHGRWHRGALRTGKYEEFSQEEPFCTYHPEHSAKWAPHEMLHRAVGFYAAPSAHGFARYVSARLNELLPVATWYGLEHALRLDREGPFDRRLEGASLAAPKRDALWLEETERSLRRRAHTAAPLLRWTLERVARELEAIDEELASGTVVASPDAGQASFAGVHLDASSDALAYAQAHARRLEHPSIARVLDTLAAENLSSVTALRARVEHVFDRLLFEPLALDDAQVLTRIEAGLVHDAFLRAALVEPDPTPAHRAAQQRAARTLSRGSVSPRARRGLLVSLEHALTDSIGPTRAREVTTLGLVCESIKGLSIDARATQRGLASVVPRTAAWLGRSGARIVVERLVQGAPLRGHLADRVARVIAADDAPLAELARLESRLDAPPVHEPRDAWSLTLDDAPSDAHVSLRAGVHIESFAADVLALHRGEPGEARTTWVAIGQVRGEQVLCELPAALAALLTSAPSHRLHAFVRRAGKGALTSLASIGLVILIAP